MGKLVSVTLTHFLFKLCCWISLQEQAFLSPSSHCSLKDTHLRVPTLAALYSQNAKPVIVVSLTNP